MSANRAVAVVLAVAALMLGCASSPVATVQCRAAKLPDKVVLQYGSAAGSELAAFVPGKNSVLMIPPVQGMVSVTQAGIEATGAGTAVVRLQLANCAAQPVWVRVRTQFLDQDGVRSEAASAWSEIHIVAGSVAEYEEKSLKKAAAAFRVEVEFIKNG